ncbi:MAG: 50S ribosomal protein L23 [Candidatus Nealsonbacteria bacterium RIFOXYB1_FULL_40_15]|uniref:Large ribosomal subunit protein uL23 n=2 Tax=Candidatus Nealsoniibacteriota TaxID=1817911 RepID=A0A1G2ELP3_9BACT|nr:MAG: 50S ribosomal protein L23 [Candidatus Nealsonbacteria bacterium RIFOXYC1_FULL_40_7]OGZ27848.1 MAG: 50S ribosomal protein L23 [Candidatus Nealsonbacteria bacterium RIFOXYB1_FULL_40_15]OGZ28947.1 MAG: 50S ribosomal protein L23 [Candidatus Nealsonbacteria bacterium RIFOXYD1_FULL_39_11]
MLSSPHVTEKATGLSEKNKYVFKVFKPATKPEIAKAVGSLYKVEVIDVKIINIPKKKRRSGRRLEGWRKGYKKAIVRIKEGQSIEVLPR